MSIDTYKEYAEFLNSVCDDKTIENIKYTDEALWSFGKWLKSLNAEEKQNVEAANISEAKMQSKNTETFTPDDKFKKRVMTLISEGLSQSKAMKKAADEFGVRLPDSYFQYAGSHIYRWRQQGY